ncbi:marR family transcriptional regulator [Klebsiella pneumoniae]|uniref:MarR family transcriptional regulator n=1 Tax=Klebsiella pneumoniae TaxID=573 RepID=A0A377W2L5_KLEPN|nr:marR family transcriptional regulator [Klebsiella pneumoniae]
MNRSKRWLTILREEILTAITPQEQEQTQRVLEKLLREVEKK